MFTKWNALSFCNLFTCVLFIDFGQDQYNPKWNKLSFCHVFTNWNALSFCNSFTCVLFIDVWSIFSKVDVLICITSLSIYSKIYFFFSAWTTKLKMFRRGLPCWFCVAKRHKNEIGKLAKHASPRHMYFHVPLPRNVLLVTATSFLLFKYSPIIAVNLP